MKKKLCSAILAAAVFAAAANSYAQSNVYSVNVVAGLSLSGPFIDRSWLVGPPSHQVGFRETRNGAYDIYHFDFVDVYSASGARNYHFTPVATASLNPVRLWMSWQIGALIMVPLGGLLMLTRWHLRRRNE